MEVEFEVPCGENERFAPGCFDTSIGKTYNAGKIVGARYDSGRAYLRIELSDPAVSEALAADARKGLSIGG